MERVRSPLAWYGHLELAIAVAAATTPGLFWLVRQAYVATGGTSVLGHGLATVIRLGLAARFHRAHGTDGRRRCRPWRAR